MRPLVKALYFLSVFGLLATHVSSGVLSDVLDPVLPSLVDALDQWLRTLLIKPLGRETTVLVIWAVGAVVSLYTFMTTPIFKSEGGANRRSAW